MDNLDFIITYDFEVNLVRLIGSSFVPTQLHVMTTVVRSDEAEDKEVELGLSKAKYWFDNLVSKSIAFNVTNSLAFDILVDDDGDPKVNNVFMMLPDEPRDELLGAVFQAKMNAFAQDAFVVESIDIRSDNLGGIGFILGGDHSEYLPRTMEEWLGSPGFFEVPWWLRNDASTLDAYQMDEKAEKSPAWAFSLDFLDKSKDDPSESGDAADAVEKAKVVHLFQPKVIKGGKNDDKEET